MKQIKVEFLELPITAESKDQIHHRLDLSDRHKINEVCWPQFPDKPEVSFAIAYTRECICLKYYVTEPAIRAVHTSHNAPVYQDSCVEFFISFDTELYYNFEFNCIGSCLASYGGGREDRTLIDENLIKKIGFDAHITKEGSDNYYWELLLNIPFEVFNYHPISTLKGRMCRANFYKCGDLLPEPHFVTWSVIHTAEPDFHVPPFFGSLFFE